MIGLIMLWMYVVSGIAAYEVIYHIEMEADELPKDHAHTHLQSAPTQEDAEALAFLGALIGPLALTYLYAARVYFKIKGGVP